MAPILLAPDWPERHRMPPLTRLAVAFPGVLSVLALVLVGCGGPSEDAEVPAGKAGESVILGTKTCWTAATLGADPQAILDLSKTYAVDYFAVAHAVDRRPAFKLTESCSRPHHVEVYKVVPVARITPAVTNYASFLQFGKPAYRRLVAAVEQACMNEQLAGLAQRSKVPGALAEPAFPIGVDLGWAPPSPEQWNNGQRVYACTLSSVVPIRFRYDAVFTKDFPSELRTCISNSPLAFVDCARKHERERIAVIDVRAAVLARRFPGANAIKIGSHGKFVQVPTALLASLDRACTAYLNAISTSTKHVGVAEIDAERWPTPAGDYPVDCEADSPPAKQSVTTEGSVFNR